MDLQQIEDNVWEIPQDGGMNVPARVYASKELLEHIREDKTLQQAKNVTHLPGIQKYGITMPDGHQGYGFPVGGVAALSTQDGAISPGAVGYDINCLSADSNVLLEFGRRRTIDDIKGRLGDERAMVAAERSEPSTIRLLTERDNKDLYTVETETGESLEATLDHPFLTDDGMKPLGNITEGDTIYINPFKGLPDEEPTGKTILTESDLDDADRQLVDVLKDRGLLPLTTTDTEFNILLKLVGYHTGDGTFNKHGNTAFYGPKEDLETIQDDIERLGFTASPIYSRDRQHEHMGVKFEQTEHKVRSTSKAFERLMQELGAPHGPKVESDFTAPSYLEELARWQQALYLSAFFGAEMSKPAAQSRTNLYCPTISHNRIEEQDDAGRRFMEQIKQLLSSLDIKTNTIETRESESNQDHDVIRYRLGIKNDSETLIRFFSTVGYRYNLEKQKKAIKAIQYLKKKEKAKEKRSMIAKEAIQLYDGGTAPKTIKDEFDINDRFIERSIYSGRKTSTRPPEDFPSFKDFCDQHQVHDNLTTTATVSDISYEETDTVYDIGVKHHAHNFAANQFVVSNCGVRMIKTNLTADQVYDRAEQIANILYQKVPSGLGKGSIADMGTRADLEPVLERGMEWALEHDYAVSEDLEHCEDEGRRHEAEPDKISQKAKDRGKNQLGSLGSGNHFLEVQKVSEIYDQETADAYGLEQDQVVILIHCGSRGLGHQVCSDYLRKIEEAHPEVMNDLPDRELAYAPAGSQLAEDYYGAMNAAINYAWTNRQLITHRIRECFERIFDRDWESLGMDMLYDVAHNIAKKETHTVEGEQKELYVHRKGATRAFPAGHEQVPSAYRETGQPVLIPGSMGTSSYVLSGGEQSLEKSFGSTAHGAGRLMSRTQAKKDYRADQIKKNLERRKIIVKAQSNNTIEEEAPEVYKSADDVVNVSDQLDLADKVARTFPMVNIKG